MKFEVYCQYEEYSYRLSFYIFKVESNGKRSICTSLDKMQFKDYQDGTVLDNPTFSLSGLVTKPFLQAIANELKTIGIKAEGEPVIENELTAVKYHLEDMRTLVFKKDEP